MPGDKILLDGQFGSDAVVNAVFGYAGDAQASGIGDALPGELGVADAADAGGGLNQTDQCLAKGGLAIAFHAGDAQDLARADLERNVVLPDPAGG